MTTRPVLIVGAGPTGLVLALWLARQGVAVRIVDADHGPGEASRAMVVHARTLELYAQLGIADAVVGQGIPIEAFHLMTRAREAARLSLKDMGRGLSPYPFALSYPQDDHERFLVQALREAGVEVEWNTSLQAFSQTGGGVEATLSTPTGEDRLTTDYLCGCDGARSVVRRGLGIGFPGGTYEQRFYVCDALTDRPPSTDGFVHLGRDAFGLMLPIRSSGRQRLIGLVPPELADAENLTFDDVRGSVEPLLGVRVAEVNWFSTYASHHRVAERFRVGRCFIAGDAGHIHSPAGGQGMNTGIGDAVNLAWKLAAVVQGRADSAILDTYEAERIAFARLLVATTDRAFQGIVGGGVAGTAVRTRIAPPLAALLTRFAAPRRAVFETISQVRVRYPDSALGEGRAGRARGGDRLPWAPGRGRDNFAPLRSRDWQLHAYGRLAPALAEAAAAVALPTHAFAWSEAADRAGFQRDAAYLVRPDGYIGLALPSPEPAELTRYVERFGLRFGAG